MSDVTQETGAGRGATRSRDRERVEQHSLARNLAALAASSGEEQRGLRKELVERLVASGMTERCKKVGERAPAFALPNQRGETVCSLDLLKKGPLVISFYRGNWCAFCQLEIKGLIDIAGEIEAAGGTLIGINPELPGPAATGAADAGIAPAFDILSDKDNGVGLQFGLVFRLPDAVKEAYQKMNLDLPEHYGNEAYFLPVPATYVIDREGIIRLAFVDPDYSHRLEPAEIVAKVKELTGKD